MIDFNKYSNYVGIPLDEGDYRGRGYTVIEVLQLLWGQPMNDIAMAYISALKPTYLVINGGEIACDARSGRVHVAVDKNGIIKKIRQEVSIMLPPGIDHGHDLACQLDAQVKGIKYDKETQRRAEELGYFYCPYPPKL